MVIFPMSFALSSATYSTKSVQKMLLLGSIFLFNRVRSPNPALISTNQSLILAHQSLVHESWSLIWNSKRH